MPPERLARAQWLRALLLAGCMFMELLDGTIVLTALPDIGLSFGVNGASAGLVISFYLITLAMLIPISAWLSKRFGGKRVFLLAIALFTLSSLGCALSQNLPELLAFRVLQAVGGAMMTPVGRVLVLAGAGKAQIVRLIAIVVWPALIAPVIAPLAGGLIVTFWGWEWIFLLNLPLGAIFFAWAIFSLPKTVKNPSPPSFDWLGAILVSAALGGFTFGAHLLADGSGGALWQNLIGLGISAAALGLGGVAALHLRRRSEPLLNLEVLRIKTFRASHVEGFIFWSIASATPFILALAVQTAWGFSPLASGLTVTSIFIGNIAIKPFTTAMINRFRLKYILLITFTGLVVTLLIMGGMIGVLPEINQPVFRPEFWILAAVGLVSGAARSVGMTCYSSLALADVPRRLSVDANVFISAAQQLAAGLGVVFAVIFLWISGFVFSGHAAFGLSFGFLALILSVGLILVFRLPRWAGHNLKSR